MAARTLVSAVLALSVVPTATAATPTLRFVGPPSGLALSGRSVWVSVPADDLLLRLDARTGQPTLRIDVHRVDRRAFGGGKLALGEGAVWVAAPIHVDDDRIVGNASGWIGRVDLAHGRLGIRQVHGDPPAEIAVGAAGVWVSGGRTLRRVDPISARVVATTRLGSPMGAVAVGTEAIWVDEPGAGRLLRIDPRTRKVVASVAIGRSTFGSSLALGRLLWAVTDRGLVAVDPSSGAVRTRVSLAGAHAVAVDGGRVWAVGRDGLYSITRGMATRRLALPQSAADLVATADGLVWFSDSAANSLGRFHG